MMKRLLAWLPVVAGGANLMAQRVQPVFEHLLTEANPPLPILKAKGIADANLETSDGTNPMDSYGGFQRYDATRLLLGVRENGINEQDANLSAADKALAAAYPDRSLVWINPTNGAPMGIALRVGFTPVPLDAEFLAAGGSDQDFYFNFTVAGDGVLYVGYKNKIVRYAPKAGGGFAAPTVAYSAPGEGMEPENWIAWRWETLKATGSGAETVLVAGGKSWRPNLGYYVLTTTDGLTFTSDGYYDAAGGGSKLVAGFNPDDPDDEWIYGTAYPGSSDGTDTRIGRGHRSMAAGGDFTSGPTFTAQVNTELGYLGQFVSDVDAHPGLTYIVSYSTPSWNSKQLNISPLRPGWIAIHDHAGQLLATHKINVTEDLEIVGEPTAADASTSWHGTLGAVVLNVLPGMATNTAEVLWYSGIYGYGRYLVGVGQATDTPTISIRRDGSDVVITFTGTLQAADKVAGPYADVAGASEELRVPANGSIAGFYRARN